MCFLGSLTDNTMDITSFTLSLRPTCTSVFGTLIGHDFILSLYGCTKIGRITIEIKRR